MNEREKIIRLWFDMWIKKADLGIDNIFTDDVVYTESWSPKYENRKTVKHWFDEWNTRGSVLVWEIKQFFHQGNQTIVEWYYNNGKVNDYHKRMQVPGFVYSEYNVGDSIAAYTTDHVSYSYYKYGILPDTEYTNNELMKVAGVLLGIGIFLLALFGVLSKKMNYKK